MRTGGHRQALRVGFEQVRSSGLMTVNHIIQIQAELERNNAGFRKLPGTALKDGAGRTVYIPPQEPAEIMGLMGTQLKQLKSACLEMMFA